METIFSGPSFGVRSNCSEDKSGMWVGSAKIDWNLTSSMKMSPFRVKYGYNIMKNNMRQSLWCLLYTSRILLSAPLLYLIIDYIFDKNNKEAWLFCICSSPYASLLLNYSSPCQNGLWRLKVVNNLSVTSLMLWPLPRPEISFLQLLKCCTIKRVHKEQFGVIRDTLEANNNCSTGPRASKFIFCS